MKCLYNIICFSLFNVLITGPVCSMELKQVNTIYQKISEFCKPPGEYDREVNLEITNDKAYIASTFPAGYNPKSNNVGFVIQISKGLIYKFVKKDENLLAFIFAHEIAHINLNHFQIKNISKPEIIKRQILQSEEFEADKEALKMALDAGFNYNSLLSSLRKMIDKDSNLSVLNCMNKEHPPWSLRLEKLDTEKKQIWKSITSFQNGLTLLTLQQWEAAIVCFEFVANQFPDCYECILNSGYAKLMYYIYNLNTNNFEEFRDDHIVTGIYFDRPKSLADKVRGINAFDWMNALTDLSIAEKLNPRSAVIKSNLGLAYLLSPYNNNKFLRASEYFQQAVNLLESDSSVTDIEKSAIMMNAGIAFKFSGLKADIDTFRTVSSDYERRFADFALSGQVSQVREALIYNEAVRLRKKGMLSEALEQFKNYLRISGTDSYWYQQSVNNYKELCSELNIGIDKQLVSSKKAAQSRKLVSVGEADSSLIYLGQPVSQIISKYEGIGLISVSDIIPGLNLKKIIIDTLGVSLLCTDYIFCIILNSASSYCLQVGNEAKSKNAGVLFTGMDLKELDKLTISMKSIKKRHLADPAKYMKYFPDIGVSVTINQKKQVVDEILISNLD